MTGDKIVRFTKDGCGYDPTTKEKLPRGTNVFFHRVFWGVSREWAEKTAKKHKANVVYCGTI